MKHYLAESKKIQNAAFGTGRTWDVILDRWHKETKALEIAVEALENVMKQPFNGSWDAQALFIMHELAQIKQVLKGTK